MSVTSMSASHETLPSSAELRELVETVRWAPAPRWGLTPREHVRYSVYLLGSIVAWTVIGLGATWLLGAFVSAIG